jgi:chromosome segregation ATPase
VKIDVDGICEVLGNARMLGLRAQVRELDADWHRLVGENMRLRDERDEALTARDDYRREAGELGKALSDVAGALGYSSPGPLASKEDILRDVQNLSAQVVKCAEETQKACSEAAQYKEWFARAEEELQEARARADKAEADLASCLAATNEVLEEALTHGREAEDGPHRALVQAVRAAARLGAEDFRTRSVDAMRREAVRLEKNAAYRDFQTNMGLLIEVAAELVPLTDGES